MNILNNIPKTDTIEALISSLLAMILFWLVFSGTTTFSGEWIPPPIIIRFIQWIFGCKRDKEKEA